MLQEGEDDDNEQVELVLHQFEYFDRLQHELSVPQKQRVLRLLDRDVPLVFLDADSFDAHVLTHLLRVEGVGVLALENNVSVLVSIIPLYFCGYDLFMEGVFVGF